MSKPVISVENISKSYRIQHAGARERHTTLRDALVALPKRLMQGNGRGLVAADGSPARSRVEEFWALKGVSFDIEPGEIVGIIGRNGAGKSTILKILSRITEPTRGRVTLRGHVASLLEVGTGFHPELTGRENVFLNGAILGMSKVEVRSKFDEIVDFAGVERFLDTPVKRYSSGMYVRLAFAVAAHLEPEVLIVDEVLAVGDAAFQRKCLGKMQDISSRDGRTVIFVSHNMAAISQLCNRCILLRSGEVAADGLPDLVTSRYFDDAIETSSGYADLTSHPARTTNQAIILGVTIRNSRGEVTSQLLPEEKVAFDLHLSPGSRIENPRVAVAIEDSQGRRLTALTSYFHTEESSLGSIAEPCVIRCEVDGLFLAPGRYLLSVSVATKHDGLLDSVDGAIWFDLEWNNNFGNGEPYNTVYGPVLKESRWKTIEQS